MTRLPLKDLQNQCQRSQDIILAFRSWLNRCPAQTRSTRIKRLLLLRAIRRTYKLLAVHSSLADELGLALRLFYQPCSSPNALLQLPIHQYLPPLHHRIRRRKMFSTSLLLLSHHQTCLNTCPFATPLIYDPALPCPREFPSNICGAKGATGSCSPIHTRAQHTDSNEPCSAMQLTERAAPIPQHLLSLHQRILRHKMFSTFLSCRY
jgi:hypothetical protein